MRHLKKGRKLHRGRSQRKALLVSLASNLAVKEKIKTTEAKAKELRPVFERLITIGKGQNLSSLRMLNSRMPKIAAMKMYYQISPRYKERKGGYTRIIKVGKRRKNDAAKMAIIELVEPNNTQARQQLDTEA